MRTPKFITLEQGHKLAMSTNSIEEQVLILTLLYTGARISEVLRVRPVDVSLTDRWICIPHLKRARKRHFVKATPQEGRQDGPLKQTPPETPQEAPQEPPEQLTRRIPLAAPLIPLFTALMNQTTKTPGRRQTAKRRIEATQRPLFPFSRMTAFRIVREASLRSGIRTQAGTLVHPHALRHSFAITWIKGGGKIEMLSRFLGHADTKTTNIYLQFAPTDLMHEQDRIFKTASVLVLAAMLAFGSGCSAIKSALHDIVPAVTVGITKDDHKTITVGLSIDVKKEPEEPNEDTQNDDDEKQPAQPATPNPNTEN